MFPSATPRKKRRGRQPPAYGIIRCVLCYSKLRLNPTTQTLFCACGWRQ